MVLYVLCVRSFVTACNFFKKESWWVKETISPFLLTPRKMFHIETILLSYMYQPIQHTRLRGGQFTWISILPLTCMLPKVSNVEIRSLVDSRHFISSNGQEQTYTRRAAGLHCEAATFGTVHLPPFVSIMHTNP